MLFQGFLTIMNLTTITIIIVGIVVGIVCGAIPGLSAATAIALCLPMTFTMDTVDGLSLLMALYVGGVSGGLISAILLKIPGTPSSVATCFDGHPMAKRGEAGRAMGIGVTYSFIGGIISALILASFAPVLARFALKFGPYEYFSLALFSLMTVSSLSSGNMLKGLIACTLGICFSLVGMAPITPYPRFTMGITELSNGFALLPVLIGLFAVSQIIEIAGEDKSVISGGTVSNYKVKGLGFTKQEFIQQLPNGLRSTLLGTAIGILPGIGGGVANLMAYSVAKNSSKYPEKFGTGIIDGIVASESSNNATTGGALIPLITLGIPGDNATAILLAGFLIHGITPGPLIFKNSSAQVYAIFAAIIVANIFMFIIEFFGLKLFVKLLTIPKNILLPIVIAFCAVGAFGTNNRVFDIMVMIGFGVFGYLLKRYQFPLAPVIIGFILAPTVEENLRRGLMRSEGSIIPFLQSPISAIFLALTAIIIIYTIFQQLSKKKC